MIEEWKLWKETQNRNGEFRRYEISNFGNVKINGKLQELKGDGYKYIAGKLVHRIVAQLFIPNPENKPCVDHIDTDKHNNRVDNLRWVTYSENMRNSLTYQRHIESHNSNEYKQKISLVRPKKEKPIKEKKIRNGKIWINNGTISKLIFPDEIINYPDFKKGRIDVNKGRKYSMETIEKMKQNHIGKAIGKIWINNGIESKMIYPYELDKYIGYVKGRC